MLFSQRIITSDGKDMGQVSYFLEPCINNISSNLLEQGININPEKFCHCIAEELIPVLTKKENEYFFFQDHMVELFSNPKSSPILINCIKSNLKLDANTVVDFKSIEDSIEGPKILDICVSTFFSFDLEQFVSREQSLEYCKCVHQTFPSKKYTYSELVENKGFRGRNAAMDKAKCMSFALYGDSSIWNSSNSLTQGPSGKINIKIDPNNFIGIQIGSKEHLIKINLSAQESQLSKEIENELTILGLFNSSNSYGEVNIKKNNGEETLGNIYSLPSAKIGPFIIHDIPVIIVSDDFYLGASFFQNFNLVELNQENGFLILEK